MLSNFWKQGKHEFSVSSEQKGSFLEKKQEQIYLFYWITHYEFISYPITQTVQSFVDLSAWLLVNFQDSY